MTDKRFILIDIRSDNEVYNTRIDIPAIKNLEHELQNYSVYNIPMNMIRFNQETIIQHLKWVDKVVIICNSSRRSGFIKQKYFADQPNIVYDTAFQFNNFKPGLNKILGNTPATADINLAIPIWENPQPRIYSITRIIQILMGSIIILAAMATLWQLRLVSTRQRWFGLYLLMAFGIIALYNGLSGNCVLSMLLLDYLN